MTKIDHNNMGDGNTIIGESDQVIINISSKESKITREYINKDSINALKKFKNDYVTNECYKNSIEILKEKNALMLIGCSGIGKSATSVMVSNYFVEKFNYKFMYFKWKKENDFQIILDFINENIDDKEILIFDDFLGSTHLMNSEDYFIKLEQFIDNIEIYDNKKFIFTCQKAILNSVQSYNAKLNMLIESTFEFEDLQSNLNVTDRIKILQKYCLKNNIYKNIIKLVNDKIWDNSIIEKIIMHDNFTPFIIRNVAKKCSKYKMEDYSNNFLKYLNNPKDIWEKELIGLCSEAQIYIYIWYSLSECFVEKNILDQCYKYFINQSDMDINFSLEDIHNQVSILISINDDEIEPLHPSLLEYLECKINEGDKNRIIEKAIYIEQIEKLDPTKENIKGLMEFKKGDELPSIFNLKVLSGICKFYDGTSMRCLNSIYIQYLRYIYEFKIEDKRHEIIIIEIIKQILRKATILLLDNSHYVLNIFKLNYNFSEILNDIKFLEILYGYADDYNIWNLINLTIKKDKKGLNFLEMEEFIQNKVKDVILDSGLEALVSWIEKNAESYIEEAFEEICDYEYSYDEITEQVIDMMFEDFYIEKINEKIDEVIKEHNIYNCIIKLEDIDDLDESDYIYDIVQKLVIDYDC